jgi:hypothetical protein
MTQTIRLPGGSVPNPFDRVPIFANDLADNHGVGELAHLIQNVRKLRWYRRLKTVLPQPREPSLLRKWMSSSVGRPVRLASRWRSRYRLPAAVSLVARFTARPPRHCELHAQLREIVWPSRSTWPAWCPGGAANDEVPPKRRRLPHDVSVE